MSRMEQWQEYAALSGKFVIEKIQDENIKNEQETEAERELNRYDDEDHLNLPSFKRRKITTFKELNEEIAELVQNIKKRLTYDKREKRSKIQMKWINLDLINATNEKFKKNHLMLKIKNIDEGITYILIILFIFFFFPDINLTYTSIKYS